MKKLILLFQKYKEVIMYLIFGVLTTLVNIITYYFCTRLFDLNEYGSNVVAWIISVLFAFVTNKLFVFEDKDKNWRAILKQSLSFFAFRLVSLGIDMGSMYGMISILKWNDLIAKVIANIIVIILNYVFSKIFVFTKKERR